jgi:hypothetical protein
MKLQEILRKALVDGVQGYVERNATEIAGNVVDAVLDDECEEIDEAIKEHLEEMVKDEMSNHEVKAAVEEALNNM